MPQQLRVVRCDSGWDDRWNAFVDACPRSTFYHRAEWRSINERSFGHEVCHLAAVNGDVIRGVLPMVRIRSRLFGHIACSQPFVNFGGPVGVDDDVEALLLDAATAVVDEWKADYLEVRSLRYLGERYPCSTHKVSLTLELQNDPELVFNAFKSDQRKDIRRAYKNGFVTRAGGRELLDDFFAVLSESWRDRGTPIYAKSYLAAALDGFPSSTRITVVYAADGRPAAAAMVGLHGDIVEGMWLGIRSAYRRQMVGYVLYWELIKNACESGFRRFHLGRSTSESGSDQFKRKWNAEPLQLYWHYALRTRASIPQLNPDNPKFRMAISIWRRLPLPVAEALGPLVAGSIP